MNKFAPTPRPDFVTGRPADFTSILRHQGSPRQCSFLSFGCKRCARKATFHITPGPTPVVIKKAPIEYIFKGTFHLCTQHKNEFESLIEEQGWGWK